MNGTANGFILIARKLESSFLMDSPPLWIKLWVWMLLQARFRDGDNLKRGQFFTSIEKMRDAMAYMVGYRKQRPTKKQIRSAYEGFAKGSMIVTTKSTRGMVITICNYDKYQDPNCYEGHTEGHNERNAKGTDRAHYNRKRENTEKKENTDKCTSDFYDHFWPAYPIKKSKKKALSIWESLAQKNALPPIETILKAIQAQKDEKAALTKAGSFCPEWKLPTTWLNQGCWDDEVTEIAEGRGGKKPWHI